MAHDSTTLCPGFRFHPTDAELVRHFLMRKVTGKSFKCEPIAVVDIYEFEPCDLPSKSKLNTRDSPWYFFTVLAKKPGRGWMTNRTTKKGRWKITGKDLDIKHAGRCIGKKRTLVYYVGGKLSNEGGKKLSNEGGKLSNWVMHEYRIADELVGAQAGTQQKEQRLVVCKIFKKSGTGPKNGEHHTAPLIEERDDDREPAGSCAFHCCRAFG